MPRALLLFLLVALPLVLSADQKILYSTTQTGDGTWYTGLGNGGNCGLMGPTAMPWTSFMMKVAINQVQYDGSHTCGLCLRGTSDGTGLGSNPWPTSFTAVVVDRCPECLEGSLDANENAQLDGRWKISWQAIECPVGDTKLAYRFEGSNPYYLKVQVRNHRVLVKKFEIEYPPGSNTWHVTDKEHGDNHFVKNGGFGSNGISPPINVRITSEFDEVLLDTISKIGSASEVIPGGKQVQFRSMEVVATTKTTQMLTNAPAATTTTALSGAGESSPAAATDTQQVHASSSVDGQSTHFVTVTTTVDSSAMSSIRFSVVGLLFFVVCGI